MLRASCSLSLPTFSYFLALKNRETVNSLLTEYCPLTNPLELRSRTKPKQNKRKNNVEMLSRDWMDRNQYCTGGGEGEVEKE